MIIQSLWLFLRGWSLHVMFALLFLLCPFSQSRRRRRSLIGVIVMRVRRRDSNASAAFVSRGRRRGRGRGTLLQNGLITVPETERKRERLERWAKRFVWCCFLIKSIFVIVSMLESLSPRCLCVSLLRLSLLPLCISLCLFVNMSLSMCMCLCICL